MPAADASYDLVVIGAGATGLGAARGARKAGRSVALVEAARPGGDCTHYGCVPSKTLIETSRRVAGARSGPAYGFSAVVEVDFRAVMERVQAVIAEIEGDESPTLLARQGIDLVPGRARFVTPDTVEVDGRRLRGSRFVLATGGSAAVPPIPGLDTVPFLDNRSVFDLREQPGHLLVLGGGPIGCELAQAFGRLGSRVTIVQSATRLVPRDEPEAATALTAVLGREGVEVRTGAKVERVSAEGGGVTLHLSDGTSVPGTHLLLAVGRRPATDSLDLAVPGVGLDDAGRIVTDEHLRTSAGHIFAAGDCTSLLQFTHVGDEQGRLAAANAFVSTGLRGHLPRLAGGLGSWDDSVVPWVTFTEPEIAHVGLTEAQAHERYGRAAQVAYVPNSVGDRARTAGEIDGFVKLVAAPGPVARRSGLLGPVSRSPVLLRLVGMTAVGPMGGELVAEGALAMGTGMLVARMAQTIHAYPTWSLSTRVAAAQFFGTYGGRSARPARPRKDATS